MNVIKSNPHISAVVALVLGLIAGAMYARSQVKARLARALELAKSGDGEGAAAALQGEGQ